MKTAVILAGGLGTRLRPVTYEMPKPMIPVQGRTLTEHVLDIFKEHGIKRVIMAIGYKADMIKEYFGDGSKFGLKIEYIVEKEPLGTGGWMHLVKDKPKEDFIVVNGDNLFDIDFSQMQKQHEQTRAVATIALHTVDDVSAYGVAELEGKRIRRFVEKPAKDEAPSNKINSGYYIFSPKVFDYIPKAKKFMFEMDLFPKLAQAEMLYGYSQKAQWFDTGTFERWERVIKEWRKK